MTRPTLPLSRRLRGLFWPVPIETEVDEEIAAHIDLLTRRYVASGMSEGAARAAALRRFGDADRVRAECRGIRHDMEADVRRAELHQDLRMDAAFALRTLRRSPLFTLVALLTIAIGVGSNTAIFSVVQAVLVRPLPYRHAERVVLLWNSYPQSGLAQAAVSPPEFLDLREQLRAFDAVAALRPQPSTIVGDGGEPERLTAYVVTPNLFDLLGASPAVGRGFAAGDGAPGSERVIVLGHALWMRRFGGDPAVLGKRVSVAGLTRTVVGVMPPDVRFPDAPLGFLRERADLWIPSTWEQGRAEERGSQYLAVVARLREGASPAAARADVDAVAGRFRAAFPDRYAPPAVPGWSIDAVPLRDQMVGAVRPALLVLAGAVGLVLLIACVNVANLLLARGTNRQREMAVRLALGADRPRLLRQLLTESTILALAGGVLGVALAWAGVRTLVLLEGGDIPRLHETRIDGVALAFSVAVSALTGILVGLVPALQQSRASLRGTLAEGSRGAGDGLGRRRLRAALVAAQVAMALVVLVAAGLLGRSFVALQRIDVGFSPEGVLSMQISLPRTKYDSLYKLAAFFEQLQPRLVTAAGAVDASAVYPLPMSGDGWGGSYTVEGEPTGPTQPIPHAEYAVAMPGYFRTMRIPLRSGRDFTAADTRERPAVVIVDETLARRHWPGEDAVGKRINPNGAPGEWATVVGVVGHVRYSAPQEPGEPQIYLPYLQHPQATMSPVVRSAAPPAAIAAAARSAVRELDREVPLARVRTAGELVASAVARQRFNTMLLAAFALAALALASVGLYGVMSYLVSQRTREIGIRIALGGRPRDVRRMVMRETMLIALSGLAVGGAASLALSRTLAGLLYGVAPTDGVTYGAIALLLLAVAWLAAYGPARRATRIDPMVALRQ
jgi:putative ABC transport system permease protein